MSEAAENNNDHQEVVFLSQEEKAEIAEMVARTELVRSRAAVVRFAGYVGMGMLPLITCLSFADSVLNHQSWHGEAAIAAGCVTALGGIICWAFNTREERKRNDHRQRVD